MQLRIIQAGVVNPLYSQAIYHGVAQAMGAEDQPALILCKTDQPYVSLGMHQEAPQELDLITCEKYGLPVIPRQVGGGTVLLDHHQLFFQFIFPRQLAPKSPDALYPWLLDPVCHCYQQLGINAHRVGLNDIQVNGKKITGTGAATVGEATVLVGSFIKQFDTELMSQLIQAPSTEYRQLFSEQLNLRMTSLSQLGKKFDDQQLSQQLLNSLQSQRQFQPVISQLTEQELQAISEMEKELLEPDQWQSGKKLVPNGIKICAHTYLTECQSKSDGQPLRCLLLQQRQSILQAKIFIDDEEQLNLGNKLSGCKLVKSRLKQRIEESGEWPQEKMDELVELLIKSRVDKAI